MNIFKNILINHLYEWIPTYILILIVDIQI